MPPSTTPANGLANYSGEGSGQAFDFDYPAAWSVIGGYHEVFKHGPTLMVAVGVGDFDLGCVGGFPGSVSCTDPVWTVPDDGVVLVYRLQEWPQGPIVPYPTPAVQPGDKWVQVGGRSALFSQDVDGNMSWALLGTPEIIEARFGQDVADTAPQVIQAVIASWQWSAPAPTPRPTPITTGRGSAKYSWQKVGGAQAGVFPIWAPDGNHLLVDMQAANEFDQFELFDRAGDSLANFSALTDMVWLNSDVVEGYEDNGDAYPYDDAYHMVPGRSISVSAPEPVSGQLPCCYPLSNGHGAVAITRYLPEKVQDLIRPKFVVWQDGVESAEQDGAPIGWDQAGDKLLVIHPTQPDFHDSPDGWLEVLSWPGLTSLFQDDPSNAVGEAEFDPTGQYATYSYISQDASNVWHMEFHIIDLATGSTARIPLAGDSSKGYVGSYAWNGQGQILVASEADLMLYTDLPDGTQVSQTPISPLTSLQSSANGATILTSEDENDSPANMQILRGGAWRPLTVPFDTIDHITLSPDGSQLFVTGYSESDNGEAGYLANIPSP